MTKSSSLAKISATDIEHGKTPHRIPRSPLTAFERGMRARAAGVSDIAANPHEDDFSAREWERGWLAHMRAEIERLNRGA